MTDLSGDRSRHGVGYDDRGVRDAVRAVRRNARAQRSVRR